MPISPPWASMGFVGYVIFENAGSSGGPIIVRSTSCDLKLTQTVEKPDVVDSKYDKTVYQLGPKEIGGSIAFPAVHEDTETSIQAMWRRAVRRDANGRLDDMNVVVKYADYNALFRYNNCIVDTFEFNVAQGDVVNVTVGVIGISREAAADRTIEYGFRNSRIVTWNDASVIIGNDNRKNRDAGVLNDNIPSSNIREFTATLNNNSDRFYTLNGKLEPQDVAATKRDIDGSLVVMGRHNSLSNLAITNETRCTERSWIRFGYSLQTGECVGSWFIKLPGCVFEVEEIALTNELFETTINWHALTGAIYRVGAGDETFEVTE